MHSMRYLRTDPPGLKDDESDAEVHDARDLKCLKRFAHSVIRGGRQAQAQRKAQHAHTAISNQATSPVTVRSGPDFNNPAGPDMVKELPRGRKEFEKLIKLCRREAEVLIWRKLGPRRHWFNQAWTQCQIGNTRVLTSCQAHACEEVRNCS